MSPGRARTTGPNLNGGSPDDEQAQQPALPPNRAHAPPYMYYFLVSFGLLLLPFDLEGFAGFVGLEPDVCVRSSQPRIPFVTVSFFLGTINLS